MTLWHPSSWLRLALGLCLVWDCARADSLIDNFESPSSPSPWTFSNGPEFPGATGSLSAGAGHGGKGAHLAYDLSRGGNYVGASLRLSTPPITPVIGFWVKSPPNITVVLRVVDASNQTLQYNLSRPLEDSDSANWYQQVVPLGSPNGWWGGPNDGQVHFPISGLSILAADPPMPGAVGAIDFDDVTAISSAAFDLAPSRQPLLAAPVGSADVLARIGANIHFTSDNRALDAARTAGLAWVRMDLFWSAIETSSKTYNWSAYDSLLNSLQARGLKALFILDYGNALYCGANNLPPTNTVARQAFGDFAEAAARHFAGRGVAFEIWNEPNISGFWPPAPDASQYAALAQATIGRLHAGDATALVITGGLSGFDFPFADSILGQGSGLGADAVGVHPYDCNPPERLSGRLMLLQSLVAQHLTNPPPVWDTEWGFSSTSFGDGHSTSARHRQAILVSRELLCASVLGFPLVIYYDLRDDGTNAADPENNFGLLANDYTDKPAMTALKTLTRVATGRRLSGFIPGTSTSLHALRFDGLTNMVVALWLSAPGDALQVTVPTNATATDFLGAPLPLQNWTNRLACTAYETNGPIYFTLPTTWQSTNLVAPTFSACTLSNGSWGSWVNGESVLSFSVLASSNLVDWAPVQTLPAHSTPVFFSAPPTSRQCFYRLRIAP